MPLSWNEALWTCGGGIVAVASGLYSFFNTEEFTATAARADGKVVEMVRSSSRSYDDGGPTYAPRFAFHTPDGELWTILAKVGTNPPAFDVGDKIPVLYQTNDPAHARIDSATQLWLWPIILSVAGAIALAIGSVAIFKQW